jgi:predicted nucleotidyltransferase
VNLELRKVRGRIAIEMPIIFDMSSKPVYTYSESNGGGIMLDEQTLQQAVERIVAVAQPTRVILFGSYGRGDADISSDVDLMVIKPQVDNEYQEIVRLRQAVGNLGVGVDVLVYSEAKIEERKDWCTSPIYWALREGRTLYDASQS